MKFDDRVYQFDAVPPLSSEDLKSPFARFYQVPVMAPAPAILAAIGPEQLDISNVLAFSKIEWLFRPESTALKNGWCILPDGTGYSLITTDMPGVAVEEEQWWPQWIMDPDFGYLNYRIWMPGLHVSHGTPIVEDLGWGASEVQMFQPLFPQLLGLSAEPKTLDPAYVGMIGSSGRSNLQGHPEQMDYTVLINCVKQTETGLRVQSVCYMGVKWQDGRLVKVHDVDPAKQRLFATHNAYEFQRKAQLLPELYAFSASMPNHGLNPNVRLPIKL